MPTTPSSNKSPLAADITAKLNSGESLAHADYSDRDLYAIALNQANLEQINLSGCILTNADLVEVNLAGANSTKS